jgi:hypothetical protein
VPHHRRRRQPLSAPHAHADVVRSSTESLPPKSFPW